MYYSSISFYQSYEDIFIQKQKKNTAELCPEDLVETFPFDLSIEEKVSRLVGKRQRPFIGRRCVCNLTIQLARYFVAVVATGQLIAAGSAAHLILHGLMTRQTMVCL
jgi:hypothetical protein